MAKSYNPFDWYWLKPDGATLYKSKAQGYVTASDADYKAWSADGTAPTLWAKNEAGAQTDAAMQAVLSTYGLALPGATIVPVSVTSAQAKIQLLRTAGSAPGKTLLDDVTAAVNAAGGEVAIWFACAQTWERANPHVIAIGTQMNLTPAQIDALFVAAKQIAA